MPIISTANIAAIVVNNIDGKTIGNTTLFTVPNPTPENFFSLGAYVGETNISNVVTPPTISIGITGPGYIDIIAAIALGAIGGAVYQPIPVIALPSNAGADASIILRVSVAAVATNFRFGVVLYGLTGDTAA